MDNITSKTLHHSVVYYEFENVKSNGIFILENLEKQIYNINGIFLKAVYNNAGFLDYFEVMKKQKNKKTNQTVFIKVLGVFNFTYSEYLTEIAKKELKQKLLRQKEVTEAVMQMNLVFGKNYFLRVKNKTEKLVSYISLLDAYFLGTKYNFSINDKKYLCKYWYVDLEYLLKTILIDKKLFEDILWTQEMFEQTAKKLFKESYLFNFLLKTKKQIINYYKGK